jgi:hypothetical protein
VRIGCDFLHPQVLHKDRSFDRFSCTIFVRSCPQSPICLYMIELSGKDGRLRSAER